MTHVHRHIRSEDPGPDPLNVRAVVAIVVVVTAGWAVVVGYAGHLFGWW